MYLNKPIYIPLYKKRRRRKMYIWKLIYDLNNKLAKYHAKDEKKREKDSEKKGLKQP